MAHETERFLSTDGSAAVDVRWKQEMVTEFLVAQGLAYTYVCSRSVLKLLWMCVLIGEG